MSTDIGPTQPSIVDGKGRIWQERTVIVNRESEGFGFTLADASPVSVTSIVDNGSAAKAGIIAGDKIIKVNGITVMGKTHDDVIEMIKGTSHVALTLLCRSLGANGTKLTHQQTIGLSPPMATGAAKGTAPTKDTITHPIPAEPQIVRESMEVNIQSLKSMLSKQRTYFEQLTVDYSKVPSKRLEKEIADCQYTIKRLEEQIASKSSVIEAHIQSTKASVEALRSTSRTAHRKAHSDTTKQNTAPKETKPAEVAPTVVLPQPMDTVPPLQPSPAKKQSTPRKSVSIHAFPSSQPSKPPVVKTQSLKDGDQLVKGKKHSSTSMYEPDMSSLPSSTSTLFGALSNAEMISDDSDDEVTEGFSPYSSLKDLKNYTAHTAVFIHYLASNRDPRDMAFHLVAGSYQQVTKGTEMRQRALDIFWTFFIENSPLKLEPWDGSVEVINKIRGVIDTDEIPEIMLRNVFAEARKQVALRIQKDLEEFQHKRAMGLGGFYGDEKVHDNMSPEQAIETAYFILLPDIKRYNDDVPYTDPETITRNHALAASMATFLVDVSKSKSKSIELLERVNTFVQLDPSKLRKGYKLKFSKNGHTFVLTAYRKPRYCDCCKKLLWGIGFHGYQCQVCEYSVHKFTCHDSVESCKKIQKSTRSLFQRKPSVNAEDDVENAETSLMKNSCIEEEAQNETIEPLADTFHPANTQSQFDPRPITKDSRSRSISEPKQTGALGSGLSDYKKDNAVLRSQSERYMTRPDSANKYHMYPSTSGDISLSHQNATSSSNISMADEDRWQCDHDGTRTPTPIDDDLLIDLQDEDLQVEVELVPWLKCHYDIGKSMKKNEQKRQELIQELIYTERTHMKKLKVMLYIYKKSLTRQKILHPEEVAQLFPSLEELVQQHSMLLASLKERVATSKDELVTHVADVLLQAFTDSTGEKLKDACSEFASNQARAERLFKTWRKGNEKFKMFVKEAESHPLCHRLKITELIPIAWQRLTKYTLLIEGIIKTYSHKSSTEEETEESKNLQRALSAMKVILGHVNYNVKQAELHQRLLEYKTKLDLSAMEKSNSPIALMYKNLDLTANNRKLLHEGPLAWRIQHSKRSIEVRAVLLTDVLILMERNEDKDKFRYHLRCHTNLDPVKEKEEMCPVIRLAETIVRTSRSDRGGRSFFIANTSKLLKTAQLYQFQAETSQDKERWLTAITEATDAEIGISTATTRSELDQPVSSHIEEVTTPTEDQPTASLVDGRDQSPIGSDNHAVVQMNKIDEEIKRVLLLKMNLLKQLQDQCESRPESPLRSSWGSSQFSTSSNPGDIVVSAIEQANTISAVANSLLQSRVDKDAIITAQGQLSESCAALQKNLSALLFAIGGPDLAAVPVPVVPLDGDLHASSSSTIIADGVSQAITSSPKPDDSIDGPLTGIPEVSVIEFDIPEDIPEPVVTPEITPRTKRKGMYIDSESDQDSSCLSDENVLSGEENIVAPPESFSGIHYVMSPDLHMPIPIPPPLSEGTSSHDEDDLGLDIPPPVMDDQGVFQQSVMEFTVKDFPASFNLTPAQKRLSTVSENTSESEA
ncbi:rho guanine nucleotide exchange factor 12-like isoform X2 [Dysidea avara]|uniref:rho guanine nucleotide exchange factor 12-like isoform X2 n=1 Tax=Dysidea avara TaxID=196820 RepID=UPI0033284109